MGLINLVLKAFILVLDLRDTYDALDSVKLDEIGRNERQVLVRNAQDGTKQTTTRRRVGTSKRKAAVKSALTTVLLWNLFHKVEPLCDRTIAWFVPFYDSFKTLFLIWMLFTRSYGAAILVHRFLAPIIRPYEPIIEGAFDITLALVGGIAALSTPILDKLTPLLQVASSIARINTGSATDVAPIPEIASPVVAATRSRPPSTVSGVEKARKKPPRPPPHSPPASVKTSPASIPTRASAIAEPLPRLGTTKARQALAKKTSQGNLAATRRVLQELPVPRHPFESVSKTPANAQSTPPSTKGAITSATAVPQVFNSPHVAPAIKPEPSEPTLEPPSTAPAGAAATVPPSTIAAANLGPPPTPPTGLRNYAFIPGMTPQRAGSSTLISPTPRFPGGFSFSFAAPQASTSTSTNPFQSQARIPATTQMAPLSISSQMQGPARPSVVLGVNNVGVGNVMTHENVPAAHDDRIVAPPNVAATIRKASSWRSLKGAASSDAKLATAKTATSSAGKKRSRPEEATEGRTDAEGRSAEATTCPRKRAKASTSKASTMKTTRAPVSVRPRAKEKASGVNGRASKTAEKGTTRRKAVENGTHRTVKKTAATEEESITPSAAADKTKTKAASSPRKKAASSANKTVTASAKPSAQRTAVKKSSSANVSRSASVEAPEASEPPQRLTRSRTKQNLAG